MTVPIAPARSPVGSRHRVWILAGAVLIGCGPGDPLGRRPISGEVTLDGRPLAEGSILFEPASGESGTVVGATIRAGRFAISREEGPVPGPYRARIYAASAVQAPPRAGQSAKSPRPLVEAIPDRYNTSTTLRVDVRRDRPNAFRFPLDSDGPAPIDADRPPHRTTP